MNAAFLLVTTAWLAGADPALAAAPAKPAPVPVAAPAPLMPAPIAAPAGDDGCGCDSCCEECGGHKLFGKLKGMFHRGHGCEESCGCDTCNTCETGHGHKLWGHKSECGCEGSCGATTSCGCGDECGCGGHKLSGKLRGLFHHKSDCDCGCDSGCGCGAAAAPMGAPGTISTTPLPGGMRAPEPIAPPREAHKKMPSGETKPKQVQAIEPVPASPYAPNVQQTKSPFELSRRYEPRVELAADYSSITGQLFYVHADGGLWVLRFAPLWQEDRLGGSVVLARDLRMDDYREGDLVTVHGEILSTERSSVFLGGPRYRAQSIQLIDRPAE